MAMRLTIRIPTCARLAVPRSAESASHPPPAVDPRPPLPADLPVIRLVKMLWSSRWVTVPGSPSSGSFSTPPGRADARSSGMPVAEAIAAALSRSNWPVCPLFPGVGKLERRRRTGQAASQALLHHSLRRFTVFGPSCHPWSSQSASPYSNPAPAPQSRTDQVLTNR